MGTKRDRIASFSVQRPVNWDEKAVQKIIAREGYVIVDIKYDGIRGVIFFDQQTTNWRIVTRENIEIVSIADRVDTLCKFYSLPTDMVYDCEVVIPGLIFDDASGLLRRFDPLDDRYTVDLMVFDIIASGTLRERSPYVTLKKDIELHFTRMRPTQRRVCKELQWVYDLFDEAKLNGFEGVVVKDPGQKYTGSKVKGWFKLKPKETVDGVIVDFVYGDADKANAGLVVGFVVKLEDGTRCNATGIKAPLMREVSTNRELYRGRYVEVERMESTGAGNSRHPHFKCFRDMEGAKGIKS